MDRHETLIIMIIAIIVNAAYTQYLLFKIKSPRLYIYDIFLSNKNKLETFLNLLDYCLRMRYQLYNIRSTICTCYTYGIS